MRRPGAPKGQHGTGPPTFTRRCRTLMAVLGILDVACYILNCIGEIRSCGQSIDPICFEIVLMHACDIAISISLQKQL